MVASSRPLTISRRSLVDQVADALVDLILTDDLREGDPLPSTAELSERFGISRTVMREALAALAGRGILEQNQGRVCVVATPGADDLTRMFMFRIRQDQVSFHHILDARQALEVMAARQAASFASDEQLQQINRDLDDLANASNSSTDSVFHQADIALHRAITVGSGNPLLVLILDSLVESTREIRVQATRKRRRRGEDLDAVVDQHRRIVAALVAHDADAAAEAMRVHLEHTRAELDR